MNEPIVSFDTLSVDPNWPGPGAEMNTAGSDPPVIARVPRVTPRTQKPVSAEPAEDRTPTAAPRLFRIDPAEGDAAEESAKSPWQSPVAKAGEDPAYSSGYAVDESPWLLELEGLLTRHSRWIALLAVITALGLTLLLLRGERPISEEAPSITPLTASEDSAPLADAEEAPAFALAGEPTPYLSVAPPQNQAVAEGPASAPAGLRPRAELLGAIAAPAVEVAQREAKPTTQTPGDGYPRTATADSRWLTNDKESTLR